MVEHNFMFTIQEFSYKIDDIDSLFPKRESVFRKASHFIILEQRFRVYRYFAGTQEGLFRVPTGIPGNVAALASLERYRSSFKENRQGEDVNISSPILVRAVSFKSKIIPRGTSKIIQILSCYLEAYMI